MAILDNNFFIGNPVRRSGVDMGNVFFSDVDDAENWSTTTVSTADMATEPTLDNRTYREYVDYMNSTRPQVIDFPSYPIPNDFYGVGPTGIVPEAIWEMLMGTAYQKKAVALHPRCPKNLIKKLKLKLKT